MDTCARDIANITKQLYLVERMLFPPPRPDEICNFTDAKRRPTSKIPHFRDTPIEILTKLDLPSHNVFSLMGCHIIIRNKIARKSSYRGAHLLPIPGCLQRIRVRKPIIHIQRRRPAVYRASHPVPVSARRNDAGISDGVRVEMPDVPENGEMAVFLERR